MCTTHFPTYHFTVRKTGIPIALSVNLPPDAPLGLKTTAERRIIDTLTSLYSTKTVNNH